MIPLEAFIRIFHLFISLGITGPMGGLKSVSGDVFGHTDSIESF